MDLVLGSAFLVVVSRSAGAGRPRPLERGASARSRKTGEAIPGGEFGQCDPRRSHATTGASVRLATAAHTHPYSPRGRAKREYERDRFPASRKRDAAGQCRHCAHPKLPEGPRTAQVCKTGQYHSTLRYIDGPASPAGTSDFFCVPRQRPRSPHMKSIRVAFTMVLAALVASSALAQSRGNARLNGKVVDEQGQPIADVVIKAQLAGQTEVADGEERQERGMARQRHGRRPVAGRADEGRPRPDEGAGRGPERTGDPAQRHDAETGPEGGSERRDQRTGPESGSARAGQGSSPTPARSTRTCS